MSTGGAQLGAGGGGKLTASGVPVIVGRRGPIDVLRSVKRYIALALGPGWEVRLDDDVEIAPFALVTRTTPVTITGPWHTRDLSMGVRVAAYPGPKTTTEEAILAASETEMVLIDAFNDGVDRGRVMRVPLYDYSDLEAPDPATEVNNRQQPHDYMRITNFSTNPLPDPGDQRLQTVIVAFTANWRRVGMLDTSGTLVQEVRPVRGTVG